jgi:hypothetical protein
MRGVNAGRSEAELKCLVRTQIDNTATGDEIWLRLHPGRLWQRVHGTDEREDGRLAVGGNTRAEATLLLVDYLAESVLRAHGPEPFREQPLANVDVSACLSAIGAQPGCRWNDLIEASIVLVIGPRPRCSDRRPGCDPW